MKLCWLANRLIVDQPPAPSTTGLIEALRKSWHDAWTTGVECAARDRRMDGGHGGRAVSSGADWSGAERTATQLVLCSTGMRPLPTSAYFNGAAPRRAWFI